MYKKIKIVESVNASNDELVVEKDDIMRLAVTDLYLRSSGSLRNKGLFVAFRGDANYNYHLVNDECGTIVLIKVRK